MSLASPYSFLFHDIKNQIVTLEPVENDEEGLYEDAYLEYTLDGLSFNTPIYATITTCQVDKLSFKTPIVSVSY